MNKVIAIGLLCAVAAVSVFAELRQETFTVIGLTNGAASVVISPLEGTGNIRGYMKRIIVSVAGTTKTNNLWITDGEGYSITSNQYTTAGATTVWNTNSTLLPFMGLIINGDGASSATITNTIKVLYERNQ